MQRGTRHISYCTNVHPGETLTEIAEVLRGPVAEVKAAVCPALPFGLGLRLGNQATEALLRAPGALIELVELCLNEGLYVFTLNGFPYGDFAASTVKAGVYAPDWRSPERLAYTLRLARVLAHLPGPTHRTISTVAGGFRPEADDVAAMATHLRAAATGLAELADETGVHIRLCLEPEPWTTLETTPETIRFFDAHLRSEAASRDHLGVCYDCCHQAVHFEEPAASVAALVAAEVPIGKVQVSSALHLAQPADPEARAALMAFAEPRYLHQVVGRRVDGTLLRALDLPAVPTDEAWTQAEAWRCHFHVPIGWAGAGALSTTRADWQAAVRAVVAADACPHLEVETYTWSVLPAVEQAALAGDGLVAGVVAELAALAAVLDA